MKPTQSRPAPSTWWSDGESALKPAELVIERLGDRAVDESVLVLDPDDFVARGRSP
jgi:hypothetical protein